MDKFHKSSSNVFSLSTQLDSKSKKTKQLLEKSDLDVILFRLKHYYDFIQIMKDNKKKQMENLKFNYTNHDTAVNDIHNFGNIDCMNNKPFVVSILSSKSTKDSKDNIQDK